MHIVSPEKGQNSKYGFYRAHIAFIPSVLICILYTHHCQIDPRETGQKSGTDTDVCDKLVVPKYSFSLSSKETEFLGHGHPK